MTFLITGMPKQAGHCCQISLDCASSLLAQTNPLLAEGLQQVVCPGAANARRYAARKPELFLATYRYGQLLRGPRNIDDVVGGLIPPCGSAGCTPCQQLLAACGESRPLYIILSGAVEEYLEYAESVLEPDAPRRAAPIRILKAGDVLGGIEFLNDLTAYPKRVYKAPVSCASAGARSVFATMPFRNRELMQQLRKLLPHSTLAALKRSAPEQLAADCHRDNWLFLKLLSEAMTEAAPDSAWETKVIVFANPWLQDLVTNHSSINLEAKDFVLEVFKIAWNQSRGLRSQFIRQIALSDTALPLPYTVIAERIVQHLLSIIRGDFPGFLPASNTDELGPFTAIQRYIAQTPLADIKALQGRFPAVIQPTYFGTQSNDNRLCYFSLSSSTVLGPAGDTRSYLKLIDSIHDLLLHIRKHNCDLLGNVNWQFFVSERPLREQAQQLPQSYVPVLPLEGSELIISDFCGQLRLANELYGFNADALFKHPPRSGFLSRFIRISAPT